MSCHVTFIDHTVIGVNDETELSCKDHFLHGWPILCPRQFDQPRGTTVTDDNRSLVPPMRRTVLDAGTFPALAQTSLPRLEYDARWRMHPFECRFPARTLRLWVCRRRS